MCFYAVQWIQVLLTELSRRTGSRDKKQRTKRRPPQASTAEAIVCDDSHEQVTTDRSETPESTYFSSHASSPVNSVVPDCEEETAMQLANLPTNAARLDVLGLSAADSDLYYGEEAIVQHQDEDDRIRTAEFVEEPWFSLHLKLMRGVGAGREEARHG